MKLKSIELKNFKNISDSKIGFKSNNLSGIYGPNGTGKTSIVESLQILQRYFRIEKEFLEEEELIRQIKKVMKIGENVLSIQIELEGEEYRYQFSVSFERDIFDNISVLQEELKEKEIDNNRKKYRSLILFDNSLKSELPQLIFKEKNSECNKIINEILANQNIKKQTLYTENTRMNSYLNLILNQVQKSEIEKNGVPEHFTKIFKKINLLRKYIYEIFLITLQDQAMFNIGSLIKMNIHVDKVYGEMNAHGELPIFLNSETNYYPEEIADIIIKTIEQVNGIFETIVSDSKLYCKEEGEKIRENGVKEKALNLYIKKIDDKEIYIENESAGIKKIISILSALVYYVKEENALVVIDELDAHIFEYLLAIILKNISEIAKGQLIFTAHNLSPLERLEKENIVITSIEKEKVNYSYLKNVSKTTNLRQKYIRSQAIWSEDNIIPLNLNGSALKMYLKKLVK